MKGYYNEAKSSGSGSYTATTSKIHMVGVPFCPDLLEYRYLGEADNLRGRVVRGFFWLIRWWKP